MTKIVKKFFTFDAAQKYFEAKIAEGRVDVKFSWIKGSKKFKVEFVK
jgi:hypothetical protein